MMDKKIVIGMIVILFILAVGAFFFTGSVSESGKSLSLTSEKGPSELVLDFSSLPEGYEVRKQAPRVKSDVSEEGLALGWIEGYYIQYAEGGDTILSGTYIDHSISRYPAGNISKAITDKESGSDFTYEEISISQIGDQSKAYKVTEHVDFFGENIDKVYYTIEFVKKDVFMNFEMGGLNQDFELLKRVAKEVSLEV